MYQEKSGTPGQRPKESFLTRSIAATLIVSWELHFWMPDMIRDSLGKSWSIHYGIIVRCFLARLAMVIFFQKFLPKIFPNWKRRVDLFAAAEQVRTRGTGCWGPLSDPSSYKSLPFERGSQPLPQP
jgi:hypothetical protein